MKRLLWFAALVTLMVCCSGTVEAQPPPASIAVNQSNVTGGTVNTCLYITTARKVGSIACSGASSGTVTSVGLSRTNDTNINATVTGSPVTTVGTFNIAFSWAGVLSVARGGTGTATPSLVQGTNVTITGTWPNQTINSTGGAGGVTSIATTSPITGGTITSTGTIACATCDTAASPLTNLSVVVGAGSQAEKVSNIVTDAGLNNLTLPTGGILTAPGGVSTGTSPCSLTAGTGGAECLAEGTVPSVGAASAVDVIYADSTQHGFLASFNNGAYLPLVRGPASWTTARVVSTNGTNGGTIADAGFLAANVVQAVSPGAGICHFAGSTQVCTSSAVSLTADVTGVLSVGNGGTGTNTLTAHTVVLGNGAGTVNLTTVGATNTLLHGNTGADPTYSAVVSADLNITTSTCSAPQVVTAISATGVATCATVPIPAGSHSAAYTTVLGDAGLFLLHPTADNNARTFTIDSNANVAYAVGTVITFVNQINTLTIAITSDTLTLAGTASTGSRTCAAGCVATAIKVTSTIWFISGPGLT